MENETLKPEDGLKEEKIPEKTGENQEQPTQIQRDSLGRFVPGQSGNPKGPGKGFEHFRTRLFRALEDSLEKGDKKEVEKKIDGLLVKAFEQAEKGDYRFMHDLFDRIWGKATQPISGDPEMPPLLNLTNEQRVAIQQLFGPVPQQTPLVSKNKEPNADEPQSRRDTEYTGQRDA